MNPNLGSRRLRWVAVVIDGTVINCVFTTLPEIFNGLSVERIYYSGAPVMAYIIYATLMEYNYQATLGKAICKICIEGRDGLKPTLFQAFLRNASKFIPFEIVSGLWGRDKLLHDIIANTNVIKTPRGNI